MLELVEPGAHRSAPGATRMYGGDFYARRSAGTDGLELVLRARADLREPEWLLALPLYLLLLMSPKPPVVKAVATLTVTNHGEHAREFEFVRMHWQCADRFVDAGVSNFEWTPGLPGIVGGKDGRWLSSGPRERVRPGESVVFHLGASHLARYALEADADVLVVVDGCVQPWIPLRLRRVGVPYRRLLRDWRPGPDAEYVQTGPNRALVERRSTYRGAPATR